MGSRIDQIYRKILLSKFFVNGWGKPENLRRIFAFRKIISNRDLCRHLVDVNHPIKITKEIDNGDHLLWEAEFMSPFVNHLPGLIPKESEMAKFQMILPKSWKTNLKPICIHLAGTGDHGFWRRRMLMAKPLLEKSGIASIILESPFYGCRKPKNQLRSSLHNVSDLFVMGGCLVLESLAIFHWCERMGFGPLGITGISMGGHMASLAATNWHKPLPLIPCLSWSTASGVFTQGVLSGAINWELLKNQYFSDEVFRDELFNMIQSPEGHFHIYHSVGQKFARDFPASLNHVESLKAVQDRDISKGEQEIKSQSSQLGTSSRNKFEEKNQQNSLNVPVQLNLSNKLGSYGTQGQTIAQNRHVDAVNMPYPKVNMLDNIKSSLSQNMLSFTKLKESNQSSNLLFKFRKDKANISKPCGLYEEPMPVGFRPLQAANMKPVKFKPYIAAKDPLTWEVIQFMRGIMDECTHLGNFSIPVDPTLVTIVAANNDGYMPRDGIIPLNELWPGSEVKYLNSGHITAYLFNLAIFRSAIADTFQKLIVKYHS